MMTDAESGFRRQWRIYRLLSGSEGETLADLADRSRSRALWPTSRRRPTGRDRTLLEVSAAASVADSPDHVSRTGRRCRMVLSHGFPFVRTGL